MGLAVEACQLSTEEVGFGGYFWSLFLRPDQAFNHYLNNSFSHSLAEALC